MEAYQSFQRGCAIKHGCQRKKEWGLLWRTLDGKLGLEPRWCWEHFELEYPHDEGHPYGPYHGYATTDILEEIVKVRLFALSLILGSHNHI